MYRSPDQLLRSLKMVKLTGPALANQAAGQLGSQLTFSNWKGRAYVKKHRKPRQPRTPKQVAMRAAMTFLGQQWAAIAEASKHTWNPAAMAAQISRFNAYQAYNLDRWRNFKPPTKAHPPAETGSGGSCQNYQATPHGQGLLIEWDPLALMQNWGYLLYAKKGSAPIRGWDTLRLMQHGESMAHVAWLWSPLEPATYFFRLDSFTATGNHTPTAYYFYGTVPP